MEFLLFFVFCHCIHAGEKRTADIGTGTAGSTDRLSVSSTIAVNYCSLLYCTVVGQFILLFHFDGTSYSLIYSLFDDIIMH